MKSILLFIVKHPFDSCVRFLHHDSNKCKCRVQEKCPAAMWIGCVNRITLKQSNKTDGKVCLGNSNLQASEKYINSDLLDRKEGADGKGKRRLSGKYRATEQAVSGTGDADDP